MSSPPPFPPGPPSSAGFGGGVPATDRVCYRHHDRRAGVSCQRCNRPICPSCMVSASVGFHCPDCAKAGAAGSRTISARDLAPTSYLTLTLVAVNIAIFFIDRAGIGVNSRALSQEWVLYEPFVARGQWWRLVMSGFLHANLMHLAFNMFALYSIGTFLEKVVGPLRYGLIYAVSLIGGSLGVMLLSDAAPTVGASGAIFGIFGAFAVLSLSRGISPMASGIGSTILLNLFITFTVPGISIGGHVGGLLAGAACGAMLFGVNPDQARDRRARQQRVGNDWAVLGSMAALGAVCFVASVLLAVG